MKIKKIILGLFVALLTLEGFQLLTESTAVTSLAANFLFEHNFHEVVPGRFYRSGSMDAADLKQVIKKHHIASVIDLRRDADEVGDAERQVVEAEGAKYFPSPMNSGRPLTHDKLERFFAALDQAAEPILVHCSSGSHRSGVASAIWLMTKAARNVDEASQQLSPRYGFFAWERRIKSWWTGYPTIDEIVWAFKNQPEHGPSWFKDWALHERPDPALP